MANKKPAPTPPAKPSKKAKAPPASKRHAKTSVKPKAKTGPVACSSVKVPDKAGGGEVSLYDAWKAGLPDLVDTPPEKLLAELQWCLVHFPSRRWAMVRGDRIEGLRLLKKLERGEDGLGLLPPKPVKKPPAPTGARASARTGQDDETGRQGDRETGQRQQSDFKATPVSGDLSFDQAMKSVFPNQRITANLERLERLQKPVFDREGNIVAWQDDAMAQIAAAKLVIEHAQGRAGEKPPPPPDKKRISYEELEKMILDSAPTLMFFKNLIAKVEAAETAAQAAPATSQPEAESK